MHERRPKEVVAYLGMPQVAERFTVIFQMKEVRIKCLLSSLMTGRNGLSLFVA